MDSLFEQTDVTNFVVQMLSVSVKAWEAIKHGQEPVIRVYIVGNIHNQTARYFRSQVFPA